MKLFYFIITALPFAFIACNDDTTDDPNNNPLKIGEMEEHLVKASNDFTFALFNELEKEYSSDNIFFSPLSISTALAMALNGANGETKQQIKDVIDFGEYDDEAINTAFQNLQNSFSTLDSKVEISIAHSAWFKESYVLMEQYRNILTEYYFAQIEGVNFGDPNTVNVINDWIALKTKDKIKDMISELDPMTVLVLVNAIYFNGTWTYEFDKDKTYDGHFTGLNNESTNCKMMESGKFETKYLVDNEKAIASVPYGKGNFEMVLYMPINGDNISTILTNLNNQKLNNILEATVTDSLVVHIPKFKIETETISLNESLQNLGMVLPFSEEADFTNIFGPDHTIFISKVLHKAFIEVNEEGTEAAAATAVIFYENSAGDEKGTIYFNRPFIFFIREISSGEILFAGKLIEP